MDLFPKCLEYGAMGILAAAFLTLLWLFVRADKRAQLYAGRLREASFDREKLIDVVAGNSAVLTKLTDQLAGLGQGQERVAAALAGLVNRIGKVLRR